MSFPIWFSNKIKLNAGGSGSNVTGISVAIAGVALAIIIMECTLAIVHGFKTQITERIMGFEGQVWVMPSYDYTTAKSEPFLALNHDIAADIESVAPQSETVLKLHQPGIFKTPTDFAGMYFTGYGDNYGYDFEKQHIVSGEFPDFSDTENANKTVISKATADELRLDIGDKVDACFFVNDAIKSRRFEVAGIYDTSFSNYDRTVAFAPISTLQKVAGAEPNQGTTLSIYLKDTDNIPAVAEQLQSIFLEKYQKGIYADLFPVDNVTHTGAIFFNWLNLLNTNVVVIFILMACIAGFTLISCLFILILDHIPTIGLLRALGTSGSQIRTIFTNMAMKILFWGLLCGNLVGIGLLLGQQHYKFLKLDPEMYYLSFVPVEINWWWFAILNVCIVIIGWELLYVPARVASKIQPAETLNYE